MESKRIKPTQGKSESPAKKSNDSKLSSANDKSIDASKKTKKDASVKDTTKSKVTPLKTVAKKEPVKKAASSKVSAAKSKTTAEKKPAAKKTVTQSKVTKAKKEVSAKSSVKKATQTAKKHVSVKKSNTSTRKSHAAHASSEVIQSAVKSALTQYSSYHAKSIKKNKSDLNGGHGTSFFNYSQRRMNDAVVLSEAINTPKLPLEDVMNTLRRFFSDTSTVFHPHSFSTYLADALAEHDIVHHHGYKHYSQEAVVRELKKWIHDHVHHDHVGMKA